MKCLITGPAVKALLNNSETLTRCQTNKYGVNALRKLGKEKDFCGERWRSQNQQSKDATLKHNFHGSLFRVKIPLCYLLSSVHQPSEDFSCFKTFHKEKYDVATSRKSRRDNFATLVSTIDLNGPFPSWPKPLSQSETWGPFLQTFRARKDVFVYLHLNTEKLYAWNFLYEGNLWNLIFVSKDGHK